MTEVQSQIHPIKGEEWDPTTEKNHVKDLTDHCEETKKDHSADSLHA